MNINMILDQYLFEWHSEKDISNQEKHGISFSEAVLIWRDKNGIEGPANYVDGEIREVRIGNLDTTQVILVVFTYRWKAIRIISARPAHDFEKEIYEQGKE